MHENVQVCNGEEPEWKLPWSLLKYVSLGVLDYLLAKTENCFTF